MPTELLLYGRADWPIDKRIPKEVVVELALPDGSQLKEAAVA